LKAIPSLGKISATAMPAIPLRAHPQKEENVTSRQMIPYQAAVSNIKICHVQSLVGVDQPTCDLLHMFESIRKLGYCSVQKKAKFIGCCNAVIL
jgi:hypothetical protein